MYFNFGPWVCMSVSDTGCVFWLRTLGVYFGFGHWLCILAFYRVRGDSPRTCTGRTSS